MADGTRAKTAPAVQSDPRTKGEKTRERIRHMLKTGKPLRN